MNFNQELFGQFVALVKDDKIEGLNYGKSNVFGERITGQSVIAMFVEGKFNRWIMVDQSDHLCAVIRRWLTSKGYYWALEPKGFTITSPAPWQRFTEGSQLDWHIASVIKVAEEVSK